MKVIRFESRKGAERIVNHELSINETNWAKEARSSNKGFCFFAKVSFWKIGSTTRISEFAQDLAKELGRDLEYLVEAEIDRKDLQSATGCYHCFDNDQEVVEFGTTDWSVVKDIRITELANIDPRKTIEKLF